MTLPVVMRQMTLREESGIFNPGFALPNTHQLRRCSRMIFIRLK